MTNENWQDMSDIAKARYIITDVLHWECFDSWEAYRQKYGKQEDESSRTGRPFTTSAHVAYLCNFDVWGVFTPNRDDFFEFDPLHDLNSAWVIIKHILPDFSTQIEVGDAANESENVVCLFRRDASQKETRGVGDTLSEAICNAIHEATRKQ